MIRTVLRRMNVLHVMLTLERAGAQEVVRTIAERLKESECKTSVCTFVDGAVRHDLEALGIPVEVLGGREYSIETPFHFFLELRRIRRRLAELVRQQQIDIVQTHLLQTLDFLTLLLLRVPPVKAVLWTIHNVDFLPEGGNWWTGLKRAAHRWLYLATAGRVSGVIAVSDRVHDALVEQLGPMRGRITTIANGVDVSRFAGGGDRRALIRELGLAADAELILTVGRLTEQKGHCHLLEAMRSIVAARPAAQLLLVGEGGLREKLEQQTGRYGLSDHVRFLGEREDVPFLLASVDLFVLPSLWEGLSIALLEAMASSTPIVATAVSGTDQAMVAGETGLVVPGGDCAALAAAIESLLRDPERARALGRKARESVCAKFGARRQAEEYLALYRRLLEPC
ncbi:MAG: glycosyltransferase family 4 protein [Planctomycetota bacterium]